MWLIVALVCAAIVTILHYSIKNKAYRLDFLALMLWGTSVMVLVDHTMSFLNGGSFIEITTSGYITDAAFLGMLMIVPLLVIWVAVIRTKIGAKVVSYL